MNVSLWVGQLAVAAVFLFSAATKGTCSKEKLAAKWQTGVAPVPLPVIRLVAFAELLGVVGLIVPWAHRDAGGAGDPVATGTGGVRAEGMSERESS